ncbi:MAG: hypothetical protein KDI74_11810 [Gammaproteobacteria bacterium]|nr:hypothetical protein [Gammaproteobacteria bacterium]HXK55061.1 hypothetical protein [Gammaproteobacteria bacterium]
MKQLLPLLVLPLLVFGCAGQWIKIDENRQLYQSDRYTVNLPLGWVSLSIGDVITVTRDGPEIQKIRLRASTHDDAFKTIGEKSSGGMLPTELAELFIAELKKEDSEGLPSLTVLSNEPVSIAGQDAFRIHASYLTSNGLKYELLAVGFVTQKYLYVVSYTAPALVFFQRNRETYEQLLTSLKPV